MIVFMALNRRKAVQCIRHTALGVQCQRMTKHPSQDCGRHGDRMMPTKVDIDNMAEGGGIVDTNWHLQSSRGLPDPDFIADPETVEWAQENWEHIDGALHDVMDMILEYEDDFDPEKLSKPLVDALRDTNIFDERECRIAAELSTIAMRSAAIQLGSRHKNE